MYYYLKGMLSFNSFPSNGDFCRLLITFSNDLDADQQNVGPADLETLMVFQKVFENADKKYADNQKP